MFYYTPEGWKPFSKVITYMEKITAYDDTDEPYLDKAGMMSAEVSLTDDELKRLDIIKHIGSMSLEAVKDYVFNNQVIDDNLIELKAEVKAEAQLQKLAKFIKWDELTTEEMMELVDDFKDYEVGAYYLAGDVFSKENQLYKVIQAHRSQEDWLPESTPALYLPIAPPSVIPEWKQPTGAHDAYNKGDKVSFSGKVYESLITGNTWSPTAYAAGWKEILS